MKNIIVGTEVCSIHKVWTELRKSNLIKGNWSDFAGYLRIPLEDIQKLHQDLLQSKINRNDIIRQVLLVWVADQGTNANLAELIKVVENECNDNWVGEKLRISYNLPCKNFQINSTNWDSLSPAFKEKVEENISKFLPNIPIDTVKSKLEGDILLDLMTRKKLKLFKSTIPSSPKVYLERTLLPRHTISEKVFDEHAPDNFLFTGLKEFELGRVVKNHETSTSGKQLDSSRINVRFMVLEQENHFKEICKRAGAPVHLLSYDKSSEKFRWMQTHGLVNLLQKFVNDCQNPLTENQFIRLQSQSNGPILISDSPGMGKSFLLAKIALELEIAGTTLVIFTPANDFIKQANVNSGLGKTILDSVKVTLQTIICENPLGIAELPFMLSATNIKIELLIDGFDEINIQHASFALKILKTIATSLKSIRLWITTRPHHLELLEAELNVLGYNIKGFDEDDQVNFLKSHWQNSDGARDKPSLDQDKLMDYARITLQKVKSQLNKDDNDIAGIPMQCFLIAEVFEEECIGFVNGNDSKSYPKVRINSVSDLYKGMVAKKLEKYLSTHLSTEFAGTNDIIDAHVNFSLKLLFPEYNHKLDFIQLSIDDLLNIGIIQASGTSTEFIHRTFAEYFVAGYIVEKLLKEEEPENDKFERFLLDEILMRKKYILQFLAEMPGITSYKFVHQVIGYFVNSNLMSIENQTPKRRLPTRKTVETETKMEIYHACANSSFLQIFKLFINNKFTDVNEILILLTIRNSTCEYVKFVMSCIEESNASFEEQHLSNFLRVAVQRSDSEIVDFLLKIKVFNFRELIENVNNSTKLLLHGCVSNTKYKDEDDIEKRVNMIQRLVEINPHLLEGRDGCGSTPLLCEHVHVNLLEKLIRLGADVCSQNTMGHTVLHLTNNNSKQYSATEYHSLVTSIPIQKLAKVLRVKANDKGTPLITLLTFIDPHEETLDILFPEQTHSAEVIFAVAIENGRNSATLGSLIKFGIDMNWKDGHGESFLHFAASHGNLDAVNLLIQNYCFDANIRDDTLLTPMDYAIRSNEKNRFEATNALHNFGGRPSKQITSQIQPLLNKAIIEGNAQSIRIIQEILKFGEKSLVKPGISSIFEPYRKFGLSEEQFKLLVKNFTRTKSEYSDTDGNSLLHLAAGWGDEVAVKELVENGADLNYIDLFGNTPLHLASLCEDLTIGLRIVKFLIDNGADAYPKNEDGLRFVDPLLFRETPINPSQFHQVTDYFAERNLVKEIFTIQSEPYGQTLLQTASKLLEVQEETLMILHQNGISFIQIDDYGKNTLMYAIIGGRSEAFLNLLINKYNADWKNRDKNHNSGLHAAVQFENLDALKLLISLGLGVNEANVYGNTPLHFVALFGTQDILESAKILLEAGIDISIKNLKENTAHDLARWRKLDEKFDRETRAAIVNILKIGNMDTASNILNMKRIASFLTGSKKQVEFAENSQEFLLHETINKVRNNTYILRVIESLIPTESDVYAKDQVGDTFLHKLLASDKLFLSELHGLIKYLLDAAHGILFETPNKLGSTALHYMVQYFEPKLETLQLIKSHGINFNRLDDQGFSLLTYAIIGKRRPEFLSLLINEFEVNWRRLNNYKQNLIHVAVEEDNVNALKFLLTTLGLNINARDVDGNTPTFCALEFATDNILPMLQILLENGADINAKNKQGYTILHCAACKGKQSKILPIFQFLIKSGIDVFAFTDKDLTFLHILIDKMISSCPKTPLAFHQLVQCLIECGHYKLFHAPGGIDASTPAQLAIGKLKLQKETISLLYSNKADINYRDNEGFSCLSYALIGKQNRQLCQTLVDLGADVNHTKLGQSLLHQSSFYGIPEVVKLFVELGLDANGRNKFKFTPLHIAAFRPDDEVATEVIKCLVENGADPNATDINGYSPLCFAITQFSQSLPVVNCLIDNGAKIDLLNFGKANYIHLAAGHGGMQVLKFFLDMKVLDINAVDADGYAPLHWALLQKESDHVLEKVKLLLKYGADVNIKGKKGLTVFNILDQKAELNDKLKNELRLILAKHLSGKFICFMNKHKGKLDLLFYIIRIVVFCPLFDE